MKCPTCGMSVPGLACERCTAKRNREGIERAQKYYLEPVQKRGLNFFAMRESEHHRWHLALFGDKTHAWCGEEIKAPGKDNRRHLSYQETHGPKSGDICPKCLAKLRKLEEAEAIREES
jgi:predicted amidophosphoribosyltransferase